MRRKAARTHEEHLVARLELGTRAYRLDHSAAFETELVWGCNQPESRDDVLFISIVEIKRVVP